MRIITHQDLANYEPTILKYRRYLHQYPELSFKEYKTSQFIFEEMSKLSHATVTRPTETSVLVRFITPNPGPKIGLRGDIDALAIEEGREESEIPFKSKIKGMMHACGHDAHAAILMTACHYFNDHFSELNGEVWAIFQHAEEIPPGGARELVATGLFNDLDFFYGHHLWTMLPTGTIDLKDGPVTANADLYRATIKGKGSHASEPHNGIDPVLIGAQIIQKLQTIISRGISPLEAGVISNTYFNAGHPDALNAIPGSVMIGGSVRSTTPAMRQFFKKSITQMIESTCRDYGATAEIEYLLGYGVTLNDPEKTDFVRSFATQFSSGKVVNHPPYLAGEDFSEFANIVPATFAFIGVGNPEKDCIYPHHHPKFKMDEDGFMIGLKMFVNVVRQYEVYFN